MIRVRVTETTSGNSYIETFVSQRAARDYVAFVNESAADGGVTLRAEVLEGGAE